MQVSFNTYRTAPRPSFRADFKQLTVELLTKSTKEAYDFQMLVDTGRKLTEAEKGIVQKAVSAAQAAGKKGVAMILKETLEVK